MFCLLDADWLRAERPLFPPDILHLEIIILELRLPPADCFYKLRSIVDAVNAVIVAESGLVAGAAPPPLVSPVKGNVLFASCLHGWVPHS